MAEQLLLDPTSEDAVNAQLDITGTGYGLIEHHYPQPPIAAQWASSVDTEGSRLGSVKHENRQIQITLDVDGLTALRNLQAKLGKLHREGGTLKRTLNDATVIVFDVLTAEGYDPEFSYSFDLATVTTVSFTLTCLPYGRGPSVTSTLRSETALPALIFTETGVKGDMPAIGQLVVNEAQAVDQQWLVWGSETNRSYTFTTSTGSGAPFYEAESRTPLAGAATAVGPAGASGAGSNVVRHTSLSTFPQAILSTQASGAGSHLSHVGTFRVFARVQVPTTNTGDVSVALEWGEADFRRYTQNTAVTLGALSEGTWRIVDLGLASPRKVLLGTQRWEGRIIASSTASGDDIDVDWLMLVPADAGSGEARGVRRFATPTTFPARDEFDQTAGALTGKTAAAGGVWAGAGGTNDLTVNATTHTAQTSSSTSTARFLTLPVAMTDMTVRADVSASTSDAYGWIDGILARYVDTSNYVRAVMKSGVAGHIDIYVSKVVAGAQTNLYVSPTGTSGPAFAAATFYTLSLIIDTAGNWSLSWGLPGATPTLTATGQDAVFATGGVLASGRPGLYDSPASLAGPTRDFDNFAAWAPPADAAMFASQSLQIRDSGVIREDSAGVVWSPVSSYAGDYLRVPPAGVEGRSVRYVVKACRTDPLIGADSAIDDISAQLTYTPRYLVVPSA